jgi:hypothetical protein
MDDESMYRRRMNFCWAAVIFLIRAFQLGIWDLFECNPLILSDFIMF